ncbi:MAG: hypothetical protein H0T89_33905 [Deltaproteobacteria bacterium]|nr:hypothetical protein [Deltaproteobacteria bacterium]MDQ3297885.1 hypothetical protein [Myxococcota bacterium]
MRKLNRLIALTTTAVLASCTGSLDGDDAPVPTLLALSSNQITIGQGLDFIGGNFINNTKSGHSEVRFKGEFKSTAGKTYAVDQRIKTRWADGNRVVWPFVGPYSNPFTGKDGDQLGEFTGTVTAINVTNIDGDRDEAESLPMPATLKFGPSIVVRDFQPLDAACDEPAKRVLGGFAYKISVEALGFTPVNFSYIIAGESRNQPPRVYRTLAKGSTDSFGADREFYFAPVPDGESFYLAGFGVRAMGTDGIERTMHLVVGVHRPIEYIDSGEVEIAQIEPAKPDSGCLSGGDTNGSTVSYTETVTETRTRTLGINWDESWLDSVSNMTGGSTTRTNSVNWNTTHTEMEGWGFGWDAGASVTAGGKAALFGLAEASLSSTVTGGIRNDHTWGYSDSRSVGGDFSESDTESWATTSTQSHNVTKGGSDFWAVSSAEAKSLMFTGLILPRRFGVFYRQVTRTAIAGKIVAYNLCGNAEVVGEAQFFDYLWSLELAQGETCSPFPKSSLPEAECLIAPCGAP